MSRRSPRTPRERDGRQTWRLPGGLLGKWGMLSAVLVVCGWAVRISYSPLVLAETALSRGEFREAFSLAANELQQGRRSSRALCIAGSAALAAGDQATAVTLFSQVSRDHPEYYAVATRESGRLAISSGEVTAAEQRLREALQLNPGDTTARDSLIYLLLLEGRLDEVRQLVLQQLQAGVVTTNYLQVVTAARPSLAASVEFARHCLARHPHESLPRLALAQKAWRDSQSDQARIELEAVRRQHPELIEAQALWMRIIAETGTGEEFAAALDTVPASTEQHSEFWLAQGIWAERQGQTEAAARCFWESLRRNPNVAQANYRLSQALVTLNRTEAAAVFAERAQQLTMLTHELTLQPDQEKEAWLTTIVERLERLGRYWEAAAWCQSQALEHPPMSAWIRATLRRLSPHLTGCDRWTIATLDPSRQIDLSQLPLPVFKAAVSDHPKASRPAPPPIAFTDDARQLGLEFVYVNGAPGGEWESMLEMNGGGIAILDYDADGHPDVYFTQGGRLPPAAFDSTFTDRLMRNRSGDALSTITFQDVSVMAGLRDQGYGQGATVGDWDNDGFPDLYVGNIGSNQFYRNNGDGTFTEVVAAAGCEAGGWTSSCVMADLNQDRWPDLYVVTYLGGNEMFEPCRKRRVPRCSPLGFPAAPDRFYVNQGDGRFRDLSGSHGVEAADGRGLGVVAADLDGSRRLSLFVSNDMTANFLFRNQTINSNEPLFSEQALLAGVAFDGQGQAKACMGIAAGDATGDGRFDLFVTNFYRQSNDFYVQQADGTFRDESRTAWLYDPGFLQLGWGTQFVDADADGWLDLIVANGHVHDPLAPDVPYDMPPQFFRNLGRGVFEEIPGQQLGPAFQRPRSGRAVARWDWNRDGRDDVCIAHLNQPVSVLTNRTVTGNRRIALRFIGVDSSRDAIGTTIEASAGGATWRHQLTAGDGFQASNERRLTFGIGAHDALEWLKVTWPSGTEQKFSDVDGNAEWLLIEDQPPRKLREFQGRQSESNGPAGS